MSYLTPNTVIHIEYYYTEESGYNTTELQHETFYTRQEFYQWKLDTLGMVTKIKEV